MSLAHVIVVVAHIVAGEAIQGSYTSSLWAACTIKADLERGYTTHTLTGNRWRGWAEPRSIHREAVKNAFGTSACETVPDCLYLGSGTDWRLYWQDKQGRVHRIISSDQEMVCVEWPEEEPTCRDELRSTWRLSSVRTAR